MENFYLAFRWSLKRLDIISLQAAPMVPAPAVLQRSRYPGVPPRGCCPPLQSPRPPLLLPTRTVPWHLAQPRPGVEPAGLRSALALEQVHNWEKPTAVLPLLRLVATDLRRAFSTSLARLLHLRPPHLLFHILFSLFRTSPNPRLAVPDCH